jgi:thioredoxin-dependent peroxiredoxin
MGLFSSTTLKPGDAAPDFTLKDQFGKAVCLSDLRGKRVILYFFPKAETPG